MRCCAVIVGPGPNNDGLFLIRADSNPSGDSTSRVFSDDWDRPLAAGAVRPLPVALRVRSAARRQLVRRPQSVRVPLQQAPVRALPLGPLRHGGSRANHAHRQGLERGPAAVPMRVRPDLRLRSAPA